MPGNGLLIRSRVLRVWVHAAAVCGLLAWSAGGCSSRPPTTHGVEASAPVGVLDPYLDALKGRWSIERTDGEEVTRHTMDAEWVLSGSFLHLDVRDTRRPPEYEACVLLGFDKAHSRYVAVWCDTFGGEYARIGYGVREGNVVRFRFDYDHGVFFNTFTWNPERDVWTFRGESELSDGTLKFFMEDRLTRRRGPGG